MARKDILPKKVVDLLHVYENQLRREGNPEDFIAKVIRGLHLDYWTAWDDALDAGKSQKQASNHAFISLKQNFPPPSTHDPFRKSCLIDSDYVLLEILIGLCIVLAYYHIKAHGCPFSEGCIHSYDYGFYTFQIHSYWHHILSFGLFYLLFSLGIAVKSLRMQPFGIWKALKNFSAFLMQLPSKFLREPKYMFKNMAIPAICLFGTFQLGLVGVAVLQAATHSSAALSTVYQCGVINSIMCFLGKTLWYLLQICLNSAIYFVGFYYSGSITDHVLRKFVMPVLMRITLVPILRFFRQ